MDIDEKHFTYLLNNIDLSANKIKRNQHLIIELANQMLYFRDSHSRLLILWKKHFSNAASDEIRLHLLYVAHDVIVQSSQKNKKDYIIGFGDMLLEAFKELIK
jgi:hypothetical protein